MDDVVDVDRSLDDSLDWNFDHLVNDLLDDSLDWHLDNFLDHVVDVHRSLDDLVLSDGSDFLWQEF